MFVTVISYLNDIDSVIACSPRVQLILWGRGPIESNLKI
jgi:hypothetical protein